MKECTKNHRLWLCYALETHPRDVFWKINNLWAAYDHPRFLRKRLLEFLPRRAESISFTLRPHFSITIREVRRPAFLLRDATARMLFLRRRIRFFARNETYLMNFLNLVLTGLVDLEELRDEILFVSKLSSEDVSQKLESQKDRSSALSEEWCFPLSILFFAHFWRKKDIIQNCENNFYENTVFTSMFLEKSATPGRTCQVLMSQRYTASGSSENSYR